MAFLDTLQKLKAGQPLTLADIQAYPTQGNAILDAQGNPLVTPGTPEWTQHVGLQSQALRLSRAQNIIPADQANQILATGGIELFNRAQQEYDLYGKLVSPDFATMMSSSFPQPIAQAPIVGGQAPAQPAPQVAVAQPASQAQPVAPQAPAPQQPAQPTGKYVQYAGSPDIFDASGRYISAQEAASIPNFQSQVQQIATPRPDIKVESDFAKLAGQNITQMVKEAVGPAPAAPVQQPAQPTAQPEAPKLPQGAEVTTGVVQKPYVQYEGSPDVFERATGKYISGEEAQKIPDFFSQVEKATSVRPGITTEEDFAKLAKTNLQLQQSGATTTEQDFKTNPLKAFQDTYRQIWDNLGLNNVKEQIKDTINAKKEVDNEMIDKIAEVNDSPWISEAERSRQITKLTSKYEQKNAANVESLKLLQGVFEMGQQEAQFVTTNALNEFNRQQTFDQQVLLKQMDLAEKMATAMEKKSFRDLVGADGRMHTYIVNDAGEKIVDLGVSELPKAGEPFKSETGANYNTRLNAEISNVYSGRYGTTGGREQAIKVLKSEFPNIDVEKDIYNRISDGYEKNIKEPGRMTASTLEPQTMIDLQGDIQQGATLQQLYTAYQEVSPSLIQSIYYNQ